MTTARIAGIDLTQSWDTCTKKNAFEPAKLAYIREEGVVGLSYSKLLQLHECPRKFFLNNIEEQGERQPNIHFAFGHGYGAGVQTYLEYASKDSSPQGLQRALEYAQCMVLASWDMYDIDETDNYGTKSFEQCVRAINIFAKDAEALLQEYTVFMFTDKHGKQKAANELLVYVELAEGYSYQMHIDCILQHRVTGQLAVVEVKTGSKPFAASDYQNSSQSMGYCVALQAAFGLNNVQHKTIYICYDAKNYHTHIFEFDRGLDIGMEWAASTLLDVQAIEAYKENSFWPRRGQSCKSYGRDCQFFGICHLQQYRTDIAENSQPSGSYTALDRTAADIVVSSEQILALMQ